MLIQPVSHRLTPVATIRDPVHGDISLTKTELNIVDTPEFQRLRHIRQLGAANLVFPGALHTRFEHSLGVVHMAQQIIEFVRRNPHPLDPSLQIGQDETRLIRLAALLHDITHVPFGHSLEDEMNIFGQHDTSDSYDRFFNDHPMLRSLMGSDAEKVIGILRAIAQKSVDRLEIPYAGDIVANTISADLLDYLKRDILFTGLHGSYDTRFMKYYILSPTYFTDPDQSAPTKSTRLAIQMVKGRAIRYDNVSEVFNLLRLRYTLGERVYYHHAKIIASTMIARAVQELFSSREDLYSYGDDTLLSYMGAVDATTPSRLMERLRSRVLHKRVYLVGSMHAKATGLTMASGLPAKYSNPALRREAEDRLADRIGSQPGDVLIYCPTSGMSFKPARVLVHWGDGCTRKLEDVAQFDSVVKTESDILQNKHEALWRIYVMMAREIDDNNHREKLVEACRQEFSGLGSEVPRKDS